MTEVEKLRKELNNALDSFENKPKYEVGKWYWTKSGSLYFIEKIDKKDCYGYGLSYYNNWIKGFVCFLENITRIATDDEVTKMLTKEAIERGLVEGVKVKSIYANETNLYTTEITGKYFIANAGFWAKGRTCNLLIMQKGIWATVIENKPKHEVGKWYWTKSGSLYFIEKINRDICSGYGLNWANNWVIGEVCDLEYITRIAIDDEVTKMLTKEAIKRGLVEGANFKTPQGTKYKAKGKLCIWHNEPTYGLNYDESYGLILDNGIWATVIKEKTSDEYIDELEIHAVRSVKSWFKANNLIISKNE